MKINNFKRRFLIYSIFLIFLLHYCSSQNVQTLGQVKKGEPILLKQNCINATYVNITSISVYGPVTTELLESPINMNLTSVGYQTFLFTNTSFIGQYIVTGVCNENNIIKAWSYNFEVTPSGITLNFVQVFTYSFFLGLCLFLTFYSIRFSKNYKKNINLLKGQKLYYLRKNNKFLFYLEIIKGQFWIVGVFGVYLSLFIFFALLQQLIYNLGLFDLDNLLQYVNLFLAWGLIPFTLFWLGWLIFVFYTSTIDIMKYQFGGFLREERK